MNQGANAGFGGRLSAVLYLLCGALVAVAVLLVPSPPGASERGLLAVAGVAVAAGAVIHFVPWHRWAREATLVLIPPTFAIIGFYNTFAGGDGFRYTPFFFVTFAWIGLVHRRGTSLAIAPLAVLSYVIPLALDGHWTTVSAWSVVYVIPSCVLVGEAIAWVSEQLMHTQRTLRAREESFEKLFSENPQPMWVFALDDLAFLEVNAAAIAHYGYTREEFLAMRLTDVRPPEDVPRLLEDLAVAPALHESQSWRHVLKDGRVIEVDVAAHRLEFHGRVAMLTAIRDVTERNTLERELSHRAFHDSLTDLANRSLFQNRVEHALARGNGEDAVAVVVLDLDGFKTVNESLGHASGDELLVAVGERLRRRVRSADTVARLGGDEFAILVEEVPTVEEVDTRVEQLLAALREPFVVAGKRLVVTASAGLTTNRSSDAADELVRNAELAMYLAKRDGKNCLRRYTSALHDAAIDRLELESDLRHALDDGQFVLHYQPTIDLGTDAVTGFEALVRWSHPRRGLLAPGEFIALSEETGVITELGRWILHEACARASEWRQRFERDLAISVNVSARQLRDPELVAHVVDALRATGLAARALTLEVTESVLLDTDEAIDRLHELKALGVRIAIDDFGTGYSSLNYLRELPVDVLKIDKVFVDGVASSAEAAGLVQAILDMARTLRLSTIAEGVETEDQAARLRALGSDEVQGFLFAAPMSAAAAEELLLGAPARATRGGPPVNGRRAARRAP